MTNDDQEANIERALLRKAVAEKDTLAALGYALLKAQQDGFTPRVEVDAIVKISPVTPHATPITDSPAPPSDKPGAAIADSSKSTILGTTPDNHPLSIGDLERRNGLYILGKPRMGKSWLMINLAVQDAQDPYRGIFFIDPHGENLADISQNNKITMITERRRVEPRKRVIEWFRLFISAVAQGRHVN